MKSQNIQTSVSLSGTVDMIESYTDNLLIHDASSTAASLSILMPATPLDGQSINVCTVNGITALTFLPSGITIATAVNTLAAGSSVTMTYSAPNNKWYKTT